MTISSSHICPISLLTPVETIVWSLNVKYRYQLIQQEVADVLRGATCWQCLGRG